jgi:hypothetical protein
LRILGNELSGVAFVRLAAGGSLVCGCINDREGVIGFARTRFGDRLGSWLSLGGSRGSWRRLDDWWLWLAALLDQTGDRRIAGSSLQPEEKPCCELAAVELSDRGRAILALRFGCPSLRLVLGLVLDCRRAHDDSGTPDES